MGIITDNFLKLVAQKLPAAFAGAVHDEVVITEHQISTPYPPASVPGNPPHMRKGYLYLGLEHFQTADTSSYTETVVSSRPDPLKGDQGVPAAVEFGHGTVAPRPYFQHLQDRMRVSLLPNMASRMHV